MIKNKKIHVKIGDNVKIISGFDKNKIGEVIKIYRNSGKILVKGINFKFKHIKPNTDNENGEIKQCKNQKLKLIEPDEEELDVPEVPFSSIINLPSTDFQKIIRDLSNISERLEIKSVGNELIFKCQGPFASCEVRRSESDGIMEFVKNEGSSKIIQGEFSLKNLGYFIKCTNLCGSIEMYLENDLPLIVKYSVASLGEIKLCLAPLPSN